MHHDIKKFSKVAAQKASALFALCSLFALQLLKIFLYHDALDTDFIRPKMIHAYGPASTVPLCVFTLTVFCRPVAALCNFVCILNCGSPSPLVILAIASPVVKNILHAQGACGVQLPGGGSPCASQLSSVIAVFIGTVCIIVSDTLYITLSSVVAKIRACVPAGYS